MCQVNRAADVSKKSEKIQTERNLIDEQTTRKNLFSSVLNTLFGRDKQLIMAPMHLIPVCHGEDQFSLKAENSEIYQKDDATQMQNLRTGQDGPPSGAGSPPSERGIHVPSLVSSGDRNRWPLSEGYGQASGVLDANVRCFSRVLEPSSTPS